MYEKVSDDNSFDISWTDLINEDNIIHEIAIDMTQHDEIWFNINIHIPSSRVAITGIGLEYLKTTIIPKSF